MTINQKPPHASRETLIERAAQVYGLRDSILRKDMPPPAARQALPVASVAPPMEPMASTAPAPVQPSVAPVVPVPVALAAVVAPTAPPLVSAPVQQQPVEPAPYVAPAAYTQQARAIAEIDLQHLSRTGLIVPGTPPTQLSEEFRLIKRQLLMQAFGGQNIAAIDRGRQILVCSAQPNEGKSFCSVNLALSMVTESNIEVLLVDADVAKPEVLSVLGLPAGPGLMDAVADPSVDVEQSIQRTSIPGLCILPAGRQTNNDTELLAGPRCQAVIDGLAAANPRRIVIFDSAPALAASPASVLALNVGQIVLVVKADATSESELREALAMLEGNARIQLLLNNVTFSGSNRKFGSYYGLGDR